MTSTGRITPPYFFLLFKEVDHINYKLLYDGDVFSTDLRELIAKNRNLPLNWCNRLFTDHPSYDFMGLQSASNVLLQHLKLAENDVSYFKQKFQIVVDSDLDGICSAAIMYKFLRKFYPNVETVYSIHTGKKHGLSKDIIIDDDTTLVLLLDAGSNDVEQCKELRNSFIETICLDHHIMDQLNPYANIVNCMDGKYPNQHLCGAAVTWLFLYGFCANYISFFDEHHSYLLQMLDLVATATISDIMSVTNEDNMYFIQNGLSNIQSNALRAFLISNEVNLNNVTIEDIKYKVSPAISAMIRMGSMSEKILLFRAFIDDYEEFDYEKRGSLSVETENIYDRAVRLCKNAKSRQDRAKQKLLDECTIHEYPYILFVEYKGDKSSTLTGLVANELANQYCKPCIVFRKNDSNTYSTDGSEFVGSIRNYDGSPINSFKDVLEAALGNSCDVQGHDNAAGILFKVDTLNDFSESFSSIIDNSDMTSDIAIGEKIYDIDFQIEADSVDVGLIKKLHVFEHYSGYGFVPVTALVTGIKVSSNNFKTMGKNTLNWKILDEDTDISYVKFKVDRESDELIQRLDDLNWDSENDYGQLYDEFNKCYIINAICTFGLNVYKGEIHSQCIIKDYVIIDTYDYNESDNKEDDDWDLEF